jgi:hypothetical protein
MTSSTARTSSAAGAQIKNAISKCGIEVHGFFTKGGLLFEIFVLFTFQNYKIKGISIVCFLIQSKE